MWKSLVLSSLCTVGSAACPASQSQPNPISGTYPNDITGTINGTIGILPVTWSVARGVIPSQYQILRQACKTVLPGFCEDAYDGIYPLLMISVRDHGSRGSGGLVNISDFSRLSFYYPFVDVLGDGLTSFAYQSTAVIDATAPEALLGVDNYGPPFAIAGSFEPPCAPYRASTTDGLTRAAKDVHGNRVAFSKYQPATKLASLTLEAAKNLTNQPITGEGILCDNFIVLWNTSITNGKFSPRPLKGTVRLAPPLFPTPETFHNTEALKVDVAFVERPDKLCGSLRGYSSTGQGD